MGERLGFIGLGIMGAPMARNLLRGGFAVTLHSRSPRPVEELVAEGASAARSPAEVARTSDIVITMLPDTPDVEAVLLGEEGVLAGAAAESIVIDMSTIDPSSAVAFATALADRGIAMLDAPVSGGERGAVDATLSIMVGGPTDVFERALPMLQVLGSNIVRVGEAGAGQVAKACNQLVVGATIEAVAEALALAARAGVDPAKVREALLGGFAGSKILEVHGQRMLDRSFAPGFRVRLHRKDARIVMAAAREVGASTPSFAVVEEQFQRLVDDGGGDLDHAALITLLQDG